MFDQLKLGVTQKTPMSRSPRLERDTHVRTTPAEGSTPPTVPPPAWLPHGKSCAICFSIDDVHPARGSDLFDAGGDLQAGVLGRLQTLLDRHPELKASLCVTPDWRAKTPYPTRKWAARVPGLSRLLFLAARWPEATMRLDRHPEFVAFLKKMERVEIVPHGLHHMQRGKRVTIEFERASYARCASVLARVASIMETAGLAPARGHVPPSWVAPPALRRAMKDAGLQFIVSARDLHTPVHRHSIASMSGMKGQPLIFPAMTKEGLVHIPVNFQATSRLERAMAILDCGGLLSVKAHVASRVGDYRALDGLNDDYLEYLDSVFSQLKARFGTSIWWATLGEIGQRMTEAALRPRVVAIS